MRAFPERWREPMAAVGLFALSVALYAQTTTFGFQYTWDDGTYVVDNPFITGLAWDNLVALFDRPWNRSYEHADDGGATVVRCDGWSEIRNRFPEP